MPIQERIIIVEDHPINPLHSIQESSDTIVNLKNFLDSFHLLIIIIQMEYTYDAVGRFFDVADGELIISKNK